MDSINRKQHWEHVFETKDTSQVSWYEKIPLTSLRLIEKLNLPKTANIIDVGSGDSFLADNLLKKGFTQITLLDISEKALDKIKIRLSEKTESVLFEPADITAFSEPEKYEVWHDRAVFHFLSENKDIESYINNVSVSLKKGGYLIISTFSDSGPNQCSGLRVKQYSAEQLSLLFAPNFNKVECFTENHQTPTGSKQNFVFCLFQRK